MRITLNNVGYAKGNTDLVSGITCSFKTGITYVLGKNGAGKSILLKLLTSAIPPGSGDINYTKLIRDGKLGLYRQQLTIEDIRKVIGFMPQHFTGHLEMPIERYLKYIAFHKGIPRRLVKSSVNKWLTDTGLFELRRRKLGKLSGGQRQKVGLIQALINEPRICILDEPFESLDTRERLYFKRVIERLSFHSVIVISTHLVEEINLADNNDALLYMEEGKLCILDGLGKAFERLQS